jgi:phospholipase/lecithinase/hemolysin
MHPRTTLSLFRLVALLVIGLLPSTAAAQIPQFDCFYVFGDSLADNGNVLIQTAALGIDPPVPPSANPHRTYFNGRFSNGYIGFEYLWQRLSGHEPDTALALKPFLAAPFSQKRCAVDFAFGGTGTPYLDQTPGGLYAPGLKGQVELFRLALRGKKPSNRSLYAIATGANDYRNDPFNVPMNPADVVRNIEDAIVTLYRLGARNVVILDLPDLGLIPANAGDPNASAAASAVSAAHNAALEGALARLQTRFPPLHLIPVVLDPLFNELRTGSQSQPPMDSAIPLIELFAPTPGMSACLFLDPATCFDMPEFLFNGDDFGYIFWDIVHPTTEAYRFLGDYMYDLIDSEYE